MENQPSRTNSSATFHAKIDAILKTFLEEEGFSGSVLLAHDRAVVYSSGIGMANKETSLANTPQTRFCIASITKQFTAAAILILQEAGKLTVQDSVCQYIAGSPTAWEPITIHHLLTHTSGIIDLQEMLIYDALSITHSPALETLKVFVDEPLKFAPGAQYSYSNSGYIVLGLIIEQVSGQTYGEFLQESIFNPLAMLDSGYDHNREDIAVGYAGSQPAQVIDISLPFAAGGLYSTVEDLYKWDQALYTDQLLVAESRAAMFTEHALMPAPPADTSYGYGWIVSRGFVDGHRVIAHDGGLRGYTSLILRFPESNITIIVLSNQGTTQPFDIGQSMAMVLLTDSATMTVARM